MYPEKPTLLQRALPYLGSLALTAAIFLALPLTQWAADRKVTLDDSNSMVFVASSPPPMVEPTPPEVEELREEEVELEKELQKISLHQIDLVINAGTGGMGTSGFDLNIFELAGGLGDDLIFEVTDLDEKPRPIVRNVPTYPSHLKRAGIQGRVWIVFIVDEKGITGNARVLESDHPDFSESAIAAVQSWKFEPGKKDGQPVKTRVRIPLSFSLRR